MTHAEVTVAGGDFQHGAEVRLTRAGEADIVATNVVVNSSTEIMCDFTIPSTAALGEWNVVVRNPESREGVLSGGFRVLSNPGVASINPASGRRGSTVAITSLAVFDFQEGASVRLARTGQANIPAANVVVMSPVMITCDIAIPLAAQVGSWDVVVRNPDGEEGALARGFSVKYELPVIKSISPSSGYARSGVAIRGYGFGSSRGLPTSRSAQRKQPLPPGARRRSGARCPPVCGAG